MGINFEKLRKALEEMTQEEKELYFPKDTKPKGWLSIEDYLPKMLAIDLLFGGTEYTVKYNDGSEGRSVVSDHNIWYYRVKALGITHWFNS